MKSYYAVKKYVFDNINFSLTSCIAQLRFGILPLTVETSRFTDLKHDDQVCPICDTNNVEDELHFLFTCPKFPDLRKIMFSKVLRYNNDFLNYKQIDQLKILYSFPLKRYIFCFSQLFNYDKLCHSMKNNFIKL